MQLEPAGFCIWSCCEEEYLPPAAPDQLGLPLSPVTSAHRVARELRQNWISAEWECINPEDPPDCKVWLLSLLEPDSSRKGKWRHHFISLSSPNTIGHCVCLVQTSQRAISQTPQGPLTQALGNRVPQQEQRLEGSLSLLFSTP